MSNAGYNDTLFVDYCCSCRSQYHAPHSTCIRMQRCCARTSPETYRNLSAGSAQDSGQTTDKYVACTAAAENLIKRVD